MEIEKILEKYRKISISEVDKGTRFEVLMKNFFADISNLPPIIF